MGKGISKCSKCQQDLQVVEGSEDKTYICFYCLTGSHEVFNTQIKQLCNQLADLLIDKRAVYDDNIELTAKILKLIYPEGIKPDQYNDLHLITRTIDKIVRQARRKSNDIENPWLDIAGYAILGLLQDQE